MEAWQFDCKFTLSEVQQHNAPDDCWMVIFDKVYNISEFVNEHPGGDYILLEYAGRDGTLPFLSSRHGSSAYKLLDKYWIGILVDEELYYSNNSSYCSVYSNLSWRRASDSPAALAPQLSSLAGSLAGSGQTDEEEEEEAEEDSLAVRLAPSDGTGEQQQLQQSAPEVETLAESASAKEESHDKEAQQQQQPAGWGTLGLVGHWVRLAAAFLRGDDKSAGASSAQCVRHLALASGCHIS